MCAYIYVCVCVCVCVDVSENMTPMSVTADMSHFDRSWSKADAPENMDHMLVTADTSHFDRSALNAGARENMSAMLATADTSQSQIGPCGPSEQSPIGDILMMQSLKASRSCSLDSGLNAARVGLGLGSGFG